MHNAFDQYTKNLLRDALSDVSKEQETEVEVIAATQKIDVYAIPDPERIELRKKLGLLGKLFTAPTMFELFSITPNVARFRSCMKKQLSWHAELERRARVAAKEAEGKLGKASPQEQKSVPFPRLVIVSPGRPENVIKKFGGRRVSRGVYELVEGLCVRIVVLSELPRTRETLLLRLMGRDRVLVEALEDLKNLPEDAQERCIAVPLLIHFRFEVQQRAEEDEQAMSAEIRAWYRAWSEEQERKQRESIRHAHDEGISQGERALLLRQLRARFGTLPAIVTARVEAADAKAIEAWGERVLTAESLSDVFDALH